MRGRPKRESFFGLFLPSVEWECKIEEVRWRELEDDPTFGTILRNMRRQDVAFEGPRQLAVLKSALASAKNIPGRDLFLAAANGDQQATEAVYAMPPWVSFASGLGDAAWTHVKEYARLEPLCSEANKALAASNFQLVSMHVDACPDLRAYWRHGGLERLASARTEEASRIPRVAAYLELQIAGVAKFAVVDADGVLSQSLLGSFDELLDDRFASPGAALMERIRVYAGSASRAALLELATSGLNLPDQPRAPGPAEPELPSGKTLDRWFTGETFPGEDRLASLVRALVRGRYRAFSNPSDEAKSEGPAIQAMFRVARRLVSALEWGRRFDRLGLSEPHLGSKNHARWAQSSYSHWKSHWQRAAAREISIS